MMHWCDQASSAHRICQSFKSFLWLPLSGSSSSLSPELEQGCQKQQHHPSSRHSQLHHHHQQQQQDTIGSTGHPSRGPLGAQGTRSASSRMLKALRRVYIQFSPLDPKATAARELLQRVGNQKSRVSNPDCVVEHKVQEAAGDSRSFIELQFADNETHKLYTSDMKLNDILKLIQQKATEMEARSVFKEVNFDPFAAGSGSSAGSSSSSGKK